MRHDTELIQRRIRVYATGATVLIAIVISCVLTFPLYSKLRMLEERSLIFARDSSALIVDEYISGLKNIALQIASRTKAGQLLKRYQSASTQENKQRDKAELKVILDAALRNSAQLVGIMRVTEKGEPMLSVGKPISKALYTLKLSSNQLSVQGPYKVAQRNYVSVTAPIYDAKLKRIGWDITLFDISNLQYIVYQKMKYQSGDILILHKENDRLDLIHSANSEWRSFLDSKNILSSSVIDAMTHKRSGLASGVVGGKDVLFAFSALSESHWSVAVITDKAVLFSSIQTILFMLILVILFVIMLFVVGLMLCLKPLTGRIIVQSKELEREIEASRAELRQANDKLQNLVVQDALTGVLNLRGFNQALKRELSNARRHKQKVGLLYIDVNDFKAINDEMGHDVGNCVLTELTKRLVQTVRREDVVARLGGDEFAVIIPNTSAEALMTVKHKVGDSMLLPMVSGEHSLHISLSVGSSIFPDDANDINQLMSSADKAMYADKKRSKKS